MTTHAPIQRAIRSRLVQLSMFVPVLLAALASAQDLLPGLQSVLGPWVYFAASLVLSTVVSASHVIAVQEREEAREAAVEAAEPAAVPVTPVESTETPASVTAPEAAPVTTPAPTAPATGA
ncbi:hypothetical protein SAMN05446935_0349 [Burkholderia sp. YR290]|nr:hypothetical protein SAMN05446935_0349 [Burkholderia sp. YR290]